jgi:hypothetical protein
MAVSFHEIGANFPPKAALTRITSCAIAQGSVDLSPGITYLTFIQAVKEEEPRWG